MSAFDDRWRCLTTVARRAPEPPLAALPARIVLLRRSRTRPSFLERLAPRAAVVLGAVAYALAAWLLPLAMQGGGPALSMAAQSQPSFALLPAPPRLPPPRRMFVALGDAIASLSGGMSITGVEAPDVTPSSPSNSPGTSL